MHFEEAYQIITVNGVKKRPQYNIFLPEGEGYDISPRFDNPVYGDGAHRFQVIILDGYRKSDSFAVRRNSEVMHEYLGGWYVLIGLKTDVTITVEGVEKIPASYSVTFSNSGGCTVVPVAGSSFTVEEGGMFRLMVQIESGYRKTADFAVSANGVKLTAVNGEYCIGNITSPQKISVSGVIAVRPPVISPITVLTRTRQISFMTQYPCSTGLWILSAPVIKCKNLYSQPKLLDGRGIFPAGKANFRRNNWVYFEKM